MPLSFVPARSVSSLRPSLSLVQMVSTWRARRRMRLSLARLDGHLLKDIGLPEPAARREVEKPFWAA